MLCVAYKIPQSVLVVIYTKALDVLLMERADRPGFWQSVTGSKDFMDEPLFQTAIREVFEETNIQIVDQKTDVTQSKIDVNCLYDWQVENTFEIFSIWRRRFAPGVTHNVEHVFGLELPCQYAIKLSEREHLNAIWLPYQLAAEKCFSYTNKDAILQLPIHLK